MPNTPIKDHITTILEPLAQSLGLEVWGVEVALGPRSMVRIYVVKQGEDTVDVEQCAELSRLLGLSLDVEDCITGAYTLEISSPGLERLFFTQEQLALALGRKVEVSLKYAAPGFPKRKRFRGILTSLEGTTFTLLPEEYAADGAPVLHFSFSDTKRAQQVYEFEEKTLPGKPGSKGKQKADPKKEKNVPLEGTADNTAPSAE